MKKVINTTVYDLMIASNSEVGAERMLANVSYDKKPAVVEVYTDPKDFVSQSFGVIADHLSDEMHDKGLFDRMKITVTIEYSVK